MDRREFFKMMFTASFLPPLFADSRSAFSTTELYLISDFPHRYLPIVLEELQKFRLNSGRSFVLTNFHPQGEKIQSFLCQKGWMPVQKETQADISLSFHLLGQATSPSFTLIKEAKILDIRTENLLALWREMNKSSRPSTSLTIASFKKGTHIIQAGNAVSIYIDGRKKDSFLLKRNISRIFPTKRGQVTVAIRGGKALVQDSSCRNRICCFSPPASLAGERIVCAPNHFFIEIEGSPFLDTVIG